MEWSTVEIYVEIATGEFLFLVSLAALGRCWVAEFDGCILFRVLSGVLFRFMSRLPQEYVVSSSIGGPGTLLGGRTWLLFF